MVSEIISFQKQKKHRIDIILKTFQRLVAIFSQGHVVQIKPTPALDPLYLVTASNSYNRELVRVAFLFPLDIFPRSCHIKKQTRTRPARRCEYN